MGASDTGAGDTSDAGDTGGVGDTSDADSGGGDVAGDPYPACNGSKYAYSGSLD